MVYSAYESFGMKVHDLEGYYSIEAPGLADQCNGHEMTYVRQSRRILGGNHTFVPIRAFMTPSTSTP